MSSKLLVFAVPFRTFARSLRLVTSIRQPLQVVEAVVVAWNDVVAIGADAVASFCVSLRFASSVRASLDGGAARRPVVRQPQASVACVPVHLVAWHAACPLSTSPYHQPVPCRGEVGRSTRTSATGLGCHWCHLMFGRRRDRLNSRADGGHQAAGIPGVCRADWYHALVHGYRRHAVRWNPVMPAMQGCRWRMPAETTGR